MPIYFLLKAQFVAVESVFISSMSHIHPFVIGEWVG
jgi:hypothetical protein